MTDSKSPDKKPDYIHGTNTSEQERLSLLNDLMNKSSLDAMALRGDERILDVGSGLGQLARRMAAAARSVVAVERDADQLREAKRLAAQAGEADLVDFRAGNATALPLADAEWGTFDLVHTRFLLEHVPDPQVVVDAMVRATKTGGRIIVEDDDHDVLRLWPELPRVEAVWRAYIATYRRLGNDPFVGRRLVELLYKAGASPCRNDWRFFGCCAGQAAFAGFVDNFAGVIESAREVIVDTSSLSNRDIDSTLSEFREWGERPDAAYWYCTFWAEGKRPHT